MIGPKRRLQIANCMYANVSGMFATFMNPLNRGDNFTWDWFIQYCENNSGIWLFLENIGGNKGETRKLAREMAKEIATTLITRLQDNP